MSFDLTPLETRVLGSLIEKERSTPENYPLSLHALTTACNQSTNREPVTAYDEKEVEEGVNALREKKLATVIFGAGSRVQKYRHKLLDHYQLEPPEAALLCVLLLRGPQTPGELRIRAERFYGFPSLEAVQSCLDGLARDDAALVRMLDPRPGQKERRYAQLLSSQSATAEALVDFPTPAREPAPQPIALRLAALEQESAALRAEMSQFREEFATFRKQFE